MLDVESLSPIPYRIVYLVRHGQYGATLAAPDPGDGPLTELGRDQAHHVGRLLSGYEVSVIHHSTLIRATETAQIIAGYLPDAELRASPLLKECLPSVAPAALGLLGATATPDHLRRSDRQARQVFRQWFQPPAADAGETAREIIISSGNLISYLVCRLIGASGKQWIHTTIQHCGISEIVLGGGRERLVLRHNDTGHLPREMQTI
jgi:broad specificity phosphatase PhoE